MTLSSTEFNRSWKEFENGECGFFFFFDLIQRTHWVQGGHLGPGGRYTGKGLGILQDRPKDTLRTNQL